MASVRRLDMGRSTRLSFHAAAILPCAENERFRDSRACLTECLPEVKPQSRDSATPDNQPHGRKTPVALVGRSTRARADQSAECRLSVKVDPEDCGVCRSLITSRNANVLELSNSSKMPELRAGAALSFDSHTGGTPWKRKTLHFGEVEAVPLPIA
jgi:hypothetical protein